MPGTSAEALSVRGRLNVLQRHHPGSPAVDAARSRLAGLRLRDHITEVAGAAALTAEERCELARLLLGPVSGGARASS